MPELTDSLGTLLWVRPIRQVWESLNDNALSLDIQEDVLKITIQIRQDIGRTVDLTKQSMEGL